MKVLLSVCLIAGNFALVTAPHARAQAGTSAQMQTLQRGVSVEMAPAKNAQPMPLADDADAWVLTLNDRGELYFGARAVSLEALRREMTETPRKRSQNLYLKVDERARYTNVANVLNVARDMGFVSPVLLTSQPDTPAAGAMVAPAGLAVSLEQPGANALVAEISGSARLKVDGQETSWSALPGALNHSGAKQVVLKATGDTAFEQVARTIDACRAVGATVVISLPTL